MPAKETLPQLREDHQGVIPYAGPNLSLYQVERELSELLDMRSLAEEESATPAELEAIDKTIAEYFTREVKKVDGICHALQVFSDAEDAARREAKRLTERADAHRAKFDRIRAATLKAMKDHGVRVLETPNNKLWVCGNGGLEPLEVPEPSKLADEFQLKAITTSMKQWYEIGHWLGKFQGGLDIWHTLVSILEGTPPQASTHEIRMALKRGEEVPGAKLLPRGEHLRIS